MPETTITPAAVFTEATLRKAQEITADSYLPMWIGPSGEESSGDAVARHLEATVALLDKDGWIRAYNYSKDWSAGADLVDDDSMTVKAMARRCCGTSATRAVPARSGPCPPHCATSARTASTVTRTPPVWPATSWTG
ncbi:hypothetical protein [Streptomyces nogalater]|uniref:Uncharacterized protein n=1 Tax=Streptomyces nogalater TaxID=38314 RepID=A0ABW0WMT8_STRNO